MMIWMTSGQMWMLMGIASKDQNVWHQHDLSNRHEVGDALNVPYMQMKRRKRWREGVHMLEQQVEVVPEEVVLPEEMLQGEVVLQEVVLQEVVLVHSKNKLCNVI
jgi:hypothetical protein